MGQLREVQERTEMRNLPLAVCSKCSLTLLQPFCGPSFSFQMNTLPSKEHEARIEPKEG